ncbi:hypothetical protein C8R46DRAFT_396935 [Mycena filopes]|nr:hypothetical protein C8R46DRAFT_396935 [Mycena filopes]
MVTRRPGVATRTRGNMKRSSPKARAYSVIGASSGMNHDAVANHMDIVDPRAQTYRPHPQGATTKNPPLVGKRHPCNQQRPPTENNNIKTFKMSSFSSGHRHSSLLPSSSTSKKLRKRSVMNSKQPLLPSTLPSYTIPPEDKDDDQHPLRTSKVRRMSWGMFQVAYEAPVRHFSLDAFRQTVRELRRSMPCATHLLLEIYRTARTPVAVHVLAASLLVVAPAFSLYLSAAVLGVVRFLLHEPPPTC